MWFASVLLFSFDYLINGRNYRLERDLFLKKKLFSVEIPRVSPILLPDNTAPARQALVEFGRGSEVVSRRGRISHVLPLDRFRTSAPCGSVD